MSYFPVAALNVTRPPWRRAKLCFYRHVALLRMRVPRTTPEALLHPLEHAPALRFSRSNKQAPTPFPRGFPLVRLMLTVAVRFACRALAHPRPSRRARAPYHIVVCFQVLSVETSRAKRPHTARETAAPRTDNRHAQPARQHPHAARTNEMPTNAHVQPAPKVASLTPLSLPALTSPFGSRKQGVCSSPAK